MLETHDGLLLERYSIATVAFGRLSAKTASGEDEQLKIKAGVEFMDVALGYVDAENPSVVNVVGVPEQSAGTLVPEAPLQPDHVFAVGRSVDDEYAVYKLENKAVAGSCKFQHEGVGGSRAARESIDAAWHFFTDNAQRVAAGMHVDQKDYLLFFNDLQAKGPSDEASLAEFIGLCSAACNRPVEASLVIPGVLRLSGSMDELKGLEDILRVAKNSKTARSPAKITPTQCAEASMRSIVLRQVRLVAIDA